jgi:hypothetical protein
VYLEITESAAFTHYDLCMSVLKDVCARAGVHLVVDDYGAGHSNLARILDLNPKIVKLDGALIRGIDKDPRRQLMVRHMVALCTDLGAKVVAECIETVEELKAVRTGLRAGPSRFPAARVQLSARAPSAAALRREEPSSAQAHRQARGPRRPRRTRDCDFIGPAPPPDCIRGSNLEQKAKLGTLHAPVEEPSQWVVQATDAPGAAQTATPSAGHALTSQALTRRSTLGAGRSDRKRKRARLIVALELRVLHANR